MPIQRSSSSSKVPSLLSRLSSPIPPRIPASSSLLSRISSPLPDTTPVQKLPLRGQAKENRIQTLNSVLRGRIGAVTMNLTGVEIERFCPCLMSGKKHMVHWSIATRGAEIANFGRAYHRCYCAGYMKTTWLTDPVCVAMYQFDGKFWGTLIEREELYNRDMLLGEQDPVPTVNRDMLLGEQDLVPTVPNSPVIPPTSPKSPSVQPLRRHESFICEEVGYADDNRRQNPSKSVLNDVTNRYLPREEPPFPPEDCISPYSEHRNASPPTPAISAKEDTPTPSPVKSYYDELLTKTKHFTIPSPEDINVSMEEATIWTLPSSDRLDRDRPITAVVWTFQRSKPFVLPMYPREVDNFFFLEDARLLFGKYGIEFNQRLERHVDAGLMTGWVGTKWSSGFSVQSKNFVLLRVEGVPTHHWELEAPNTRKSIKLKFED